MNEKPEFVSWISEKDFPLVEFGESIESEIVGVFVALLSASDNYKMLPL